MLRPIFFRLEEEKVQYDRKDEKIQNNGKRFDSA
jgi:hypothetical protein